MYEPCHGSAPDIANQDIANPLAMISSLSMALKFSLKEEKISKKLDKSIKTYIKNGHRTKDIAAGQAHINTSEVADIIIEILKNE